jgi:hypothetical protein
MFGKTLRRSDQTILQVGTLLDSIIDVGCQIHKSTVKCCLHVFRGSRSPTASGPSISVQIWIDEFSRSGTIDITLIINQTEGFENTTGGTKRSLIIAGRRKVELSINSIE